MTRFLIAAVFTCAVTSGGVKVLFCSLMDKFDFL